MNRLFLKLLLALAISIPTYASDNKTQAFEAWTVDVEIDEFEGERKPTLESEVRSLDGTVIGSMRISYFIKAQGDFQSAFVSFRIKGLRDSFPYCDYEYLKFKIDSSESAFFPTYGHACPALQLKNDMVKKLSSGAVFRFSAGTKVGVVNLNGFKEAWAYTLVNLKPNKNSY